MTHREMEEHREYPIVRLWYTKCKGKTIEEIIDHNLSFFEWMLNTFQDITPSQANYYERATGKKVKKEYIRDVIPYNYEKGDSDKLYMELCKTYNLEDTLKRYRSNQLNLF